MKKIKLLLVLIIVGLLGLIFYQNKEFFLAPHVLDLDLGFTKLDLPEIPHILYHLIFGIAGFLMVGFLWFLYFLRTRKKLKGLNAIIDSHIETIKSLKQQTNSSQDVEISSLEPILEPILEPSLEVVSKSDSKLTKAD